MKRSEMIEWYINRYLKIQAILVAIVVAVFLALLLYQ